MRKPRPTQLLVGLFAATMVFSAMPAADARPRVADQSATAQAMESLRLGKAEIGQDRRGISLQHQLAQAQQRLADQPRGEALYQVAEDGRYTAVTDARSPRLSESSQSAVTAVDPVTWQECADNFDDRVAPYWFKNKYNICRRILFTITYRELQSGVVVEVGATQLVVDFIGTAQDTQNVVDFGVRMTNFVDQGRTHKEWSLNLQLPCVNADPQRTSTCTPPAGMPEVYEMSIQDWQNRNGEPVWLNKVATTTAVPADKYSAELRGFLSFALQFVLLAPLGPDVFQFPQELLRCDVASYVGGSRCVFPRVASVLQFSASDPTLSESATFIRDAQTDITRTSPGIPGTKVAGALGEQPLHRLFSTYDSNKDIVASRRKVQKTCRRYHGPGYTTGPGGQARQCDEYPFATTYENAARVNTSSAYSYGVRAISADHNQRAGIVYGIWLRQDHILDGDPFWVRIVP